MFAIRFQTWLIEFVVWTMQVEVNYDEPNYFDGPTISVHNFARHQHVPCKFVIFYHKGSTETLAYRLKVTDAWEEFKPWSL